MWKQQCPCGDWNCCTKSEGDYQTVIELTSRWKQFSLLEGQWLLMEWKMSLKRRWDIVEREPMAYKARMQKAKKFEQFKGQNVWQAPKGYKLNREASQETMMEFIVQCVWWFAACISESASTEKPMYCNKAGAAMELSYWPINHQIKLLSSLRDFMCLTNIILLLFLGSMLHPRVCFSSY